MDWDKLQRPGFSPDYVDQRYERVDLAFERSDWLPTVAAEALVDANRPVLVYIAGKPARFTSKDHNVHAGETVEKQLIVINNSRGDRLRRLPLVLRSATGARGRTKRPHQDGRAGSPAGPFRITEHSRLASTRSAPWSFSTALRSGQTPSRSTSCHEPRLRH